MCQLPYACLFSVYVCGCQVPAYAAGANCLYDLTPVASQDKLKDLSTTELHGWGLQLKQHAT